MQMTRIDGLSYAIDGDFIDLEQDCGLGEVDRVRLHRIHLEHLAREVGLFAPDQTAERTVGVLQRRLRNLAREIHSLAEWVRSAPDDGEDSFPDFLQVTALDTLAQALIDDLPEGTAINLIAGINQIDCPAAQEQDSSTAESDTASHPTLIDQGQMDLLASLHDARGCSSAERRAP